MHKCHRILLSIWALSPCVGNTALVLRKLRRSLVFKRSVMFLRGERCSPTLLIEFVGSVYSSRAAVKFISNIFLSLSLSLSSPLSLPSTLLHSWSEQQGLEVSVVTERCPSANCMLHVTPCKVIETRIAPLSLPLCPINEWMTGQSNILLLLQIIESHAG